MRPGFLTASIAWRYLRAPKSHSAVNAISIISMVGVAVATSAIVCVLSVFNGFRGLLTEKLDTLAPDVVITPAAGKVFADGDSVRNILKTIPGVGTVMQTVTDNALAIVDAREMPITLKGVDFKTYPRLTQIDSITLGRTPVSTLTAGDAVASVGVAHQLGIRTVGEPMLVFAPRREGRVNMANPVESFISDSVRIADVFQAYQSDYDEKTVLCDIDLARSMFQYTGEATSVEVNARPGVKPDDLARDIAARLGPSAVVRDRYRQQDLNFRMVEIEKWVTFMMLTFILVIATFNIVTTVCMLVLDKQKSMHTLRALGMRRGLIARIFASESVYVSMGGALAGVALGLVLCLLQQHFGLIRLAGDPANMVITAYPVRVEPIDILWALLPPFVLGLLTAAIAATFAKQKIKS